jgi:hypothetical protein
MISVVQYVREITCGPAAIAASERKHESGNGLNCKQVLVSLRPYQELETGLLLQKVIY